MGLSCGPVGSKSYCRPCPLFEGLAVAVASKRDTIPAKQVGLPAQLYWNVKRTKLTGTTQMHANSLTACFEPKDYVGHLSTTCQMWVLQMRGGCSGDTLCHHFLQYSPVDCWCCHHLFYSVVKTHDEPIKTNKPWNLPSVRVSRISRPGHWLPETQSCLWCFLIWSS